MVASALALTTNAGDFEQAEQCRTQGNHSDVLELYLSAAAEGHPIANHWVGTYYFEGIGTDKNPAEAAKHFLAGAHLGVEGAMVYLANIYLNGKGLPKDCERAKFWITRATKGNVSEVWEADLKSCA